MPDREQIRQKMQRDGVEFILAQFVDMHGAAKVKMVPASCLDDVIDDGAGFAGAAVWGVGQGPHSHDMMARIDLETYTPLPWLQNTARFAADLFVDGESLYQIERDRFSLRGRVNLDSTLTSEEGTTGLVQVSKRRTNWSLTPSWRRSLTERLSFDLSGSYRETDYEDAVFHNKQPSSL